MNDWLWTDWARLWNEGAIYREADPPDYRKAAAARRERRLTDRRLVLARVEAAAWRALVRERECVWAQEPDGGPWQTLCGREFELIDGTPRDNDMNFCCYCGGSLEQIEYADEAEGGSR